MKQETIEEAGAIAAGLCEHLEAKEQAMFIAGFQECAKWQAERKKLKNLNQNKMAIILSVIMIQLAIITIVLSEISNLMLKAKERAVDKALPEIFYWNDIGTDSTKKAYKKAYKSIEKPEHINF